MAARIYFAVERSSANTDGWLYLVIPAGFIWFHLRLHLVIRTVILGYMKSLREELQAGSGFTTDKSQAAIYKAAKQLGLSVKTGT